MFDSNLVLLGLGCNLVCNLTVFNEYSFKSIAFLICSLVIVSDKNNLAIAPAIPTLKAGSTIGIPSPPAIAFPSGKVAMPDIRDAERLQGFPCNWTMPAEEIAKPSIRWKLVGNAVTVNTIAWIANKFVNPEKYDITKDKPLDEEKWPHAAWGEKGKRFCSKATTLPATARESGLEDFLEFPLKGLSLRASKGFYSRLQEGNLKRPDYFNNILVEHIKNCKK